MGEGARELRVWRDEAEIAAGRNRSEAWSDSKM